MDLEGPIPYTVRVRANCRRLRIRVTHEHGVVVTVPRGFAASRIQSLLLRERAWIRSALERVRARQAQLAAEGSWRLPSQIALPALGATWTLSASASPSATVTLRELPARQLLVRGAIDDEMACRRALSRWIVRQAHLQLVPQLHAHSLRLGLHYKRVSIRRQRTRWASCSSRGTVSLSANLLFLEPAYVDYVMTHELCHLREMNHSRRFWQLVAQHCPAYREIDGRLRQMSGAIPRWAVPGP
jgi:predicted metal-dependent hydrolase